MKQQWIPYIREDYLQKKAAAGFLVKGGLKLLGKIGLKGKARTNLLRTGGKVLSGAGTALNVGTTALMAKDVYDAVSGSGGDNQQTTVDSGNQQSLNTSAPPPNTSTGVGN